MKYMETVLDFPVRSASLLGIVSSPAADRPASGVGVIVVVGGPQYRVGSQRQFALLCRTLAGQGHHCLRFDYRGMGDAEGEAIDFEHCTEDIGAAIAALRGRQPGLRRIVLWGLCDGASAILLYLHEAGSKAGVDGICLLNPWVRTPASLATTQVKHYYRDRLKQREFWLKLLKGGVARKAITDLLGNLRAMRRSAAPAGAALPFYERMALAWRAFGGPIQLVLSGQDYTAKEFLEQAGALPIWHGCLDMGTVSRFELPEADHTFSNPKARGEVEARVHAWLQESFVA
jgi:exosortase A-associated hydrolase 1